MGHTSQMVNAHLGRAARHALSHDRDALHPRGRPDGPDPLHRRDGLRRRGDHQPDRPNDPRVRYMHERGFPFATHGRTDMGLAHPYFDFDNEAFARIMVREMAARGRKRLALVAPPTRAELFRPHDPGVHRRGRAAGSGGAGVRRGDERYQRLAGRGLLAAASLSGRTGPTGCCWGRPRPRWRWSRGARHCGLVLGRDFDVGTKDSVRFLRRFRADMLVVHEDVGEAGDFLARAVMRAIDRRSPQEPTQHLDVPAAIS